MNLFIFMLIHAEKGEMECKYWLDTENFFQKVTIMEKAFNISNVRIENDFLVLMVDNQLISLKLSQISQKLANALKDERETIKISPSGYGLHWPLLDEDLSVNGLLKQYEENRFLQQSV